MYAINGTYVARDGGILNVKGKCQQIIRTMIEPGLPGTEKERAVRGYVVTHTGYDIENYRGGSISVELHTRYGVLKSG